MANEINYKGPRGGGKPIIKSSQIIDVTYNSGTSKQVTIDAVNDAKAVALFEVYDLDGLLQPRATTFTYDFINQTTLEFTWGVNVTGYNLKVIITILEFGDNVVVQKGTSVWSAGELSAGIKDIDITAVNLDTALVFQSTLVETLTNSIVATAHSIKLLDTDTIRLNAASTVGPKTTSWAVADYGG